MPAITIANKLLHYEVLGRGRSVVLLHSWLGSWRYWVPAMRQLSTSYRNHSLDLFGFGDSAKIITADNNDYDIAVHVDTVRHFLDSLGYPKAALIGHGLGALTALHFAHEYPERVPKLMLVSLPLFEVGGMVVDNPFQTTPTMDTLAQWLGMCFETGSPDLEWVTDEILKCDIRAVQQGLQSYNASQALDMISQLTMSTVLLHGTHDPLVPPPPAQIYEYLEQTNPDSFLAVSWPQVRHYPMLENSNFAAFVKDFLDTADLVPMRTTDYTQVAELQVPHVFISYSRRDSTIMQAICDDLQAESIPIWVDTNLEPGTPSWLTTIQENIDKASYLVVLWSPDAKNSRWVTEELNYARIQEVRIFSVLVRGDERTSISFGYTQHQWIDMRQDYAVGIATLIEALKNELFL